MKKLLITLPLAIVTAFGAFAVNASAQQVQVNGIGSSALFLEAGLGASSLTTGSINAPCVWTTNNPSTPPTPTNIVKATDISTPAGALTDAGNAWVAWTVGTGTNVSCTNPGTDSQVYAYLQTDSVVGDRCLFNANSASGTLCSIAYPTGVPASAAVLYPLNDPARVETPLPTSIANALNASKVNAAGTDIRPEDAWFATKRALTPCATAVTIPNAPASGTNTQYLGLGYSNGQNIESVFGGAPFHVIDFDIPTKSGNVYAVTPVGATPILVVINGPTSGFGASSGFSNIESTTLAQFLDGRLSLTNEVNGVSSGNKVNTIIREPLSGTYNTMEYNVPNRTASGFQTSQDVGMTQPTAQRNCNNSGAGPLTGPNPMSILSLGGGLRERAIGTGQALTQVVNGSTQDTLGYGFWSVANFAPFSGSTATNAKYLTVDNVDPLITTSGNHTGKIPLAGSTDIENVTLNHVGTVGDYPIWSLLRFVTATTSTTVPAAVTNLASATQNFVSFGTTASRPDFITVANLKVVRSHFVPPAPNPVVAGTTDGQPTPAANGHVGTATNTCSVAEQGGDVGGQVFLLTQDITFCANPANPKTGQTNLRR